MNCHLPIRIVPSSLYNSGRLSSCFNLLCSFIFRAQRTRFTRLSFIIHNVFKTTVAIDFSTIALFKSSEGQWLREQLADIDNVGRREIIPCEAFYTFAFNLPVHDIVEAD